MWYNFLYRVTETDFQFGKAPCNLRTMLSLRSELSERNMPLFQAIVT